MGRAVAAELQGLSEDGHGRCCASMPVTACKIPRGVADRKQPQPMFFFATPRFSAQDADCVREIRRARRILVGVRPPGWWTIAEGRYKVGNRSAISRSAIYICDTR